LLVEWFAWWTEMSALRASEQLDAFMVHQLADAGWKMDRKSVVEQWQRIAARETVKVVAVGDENNLDEQTKLHQEAMMIREWLRSAYGSAVN